MAMQRQPVERVIDLVVGFPVATAVAARRSIPLIRQASRQGVRKIAGRARRAAGPGPATSPPGESDVSAPTPVAPDTDNAPAVDEPSAADGAVVGVVLPIEDYDHLAARQVVDRLATLTALELTQVESYERAHRHRQTVLGRIAQLQS